MPPTASKTKLPPVYADTSLLFSLVLHDANTAAVVAYLTTHATPLAFTPWQRCELHNALRLAVWRRHCDPVVAKVALEQIAADVAAGDLHEIPLVWADVLHLAEELGAKHTASLGVRTLDLLHVAAALSLGVRVFLTCDARQLALAKAAGLRAEKV